MLAGIREILIITTPQDQAIFESLLGNGDRFGVKFQYLKQEKPDGLAQAFIIGERFIGIEKVALILGDNIFYGDGLGRKLSACTNVDGALIFAYQVSDPHRYGIVEFDTENKVISIEEKPENPKSNFAVPGLYFYDNKVIEISKNIRPSKRGELEITDINIEYLKLNKLTTSVLDRGTAWLDTGTFNSLQAASTFIQVVEERQGIKIACLEEIAWRNNWISDRDLYESASRYGGSPFSEYLKQLIT